MGGGCIVGQTDQLRGRRRACGRQHSVGVVEEGPAGPPARLGLRLDLDRGLHRPQEQTGRRNVPT